MTYPEWWRDEPYEATATYPAAWGKVLIPER